MTFLTYTVSCKTKKKAVTFFQNGDFKLFSSGNTLVFDQARCSQDRFWEGVRDPKNWTF